MTMASPDWVDETALDRARRGERIGRILTHAERLILTTEIIDVGGGVTAVGRVCRASGTVSEELIAEVRSRKDPRRRQEILDRLDPEVVAVVPVAEQLVAAVHSMDADAVRAAIAAAGSDLPALCVTLAAGILGDADLVRAIGWATNTDEYLRLRDVGVRAAAAVVLAEQPPTPDSPATAVLEVCRAS